LDDVVSLVARTIDAAGDNKALPEEFPQHLLPMFSDYGRTLRTDEWVEQTPFQANRASRYDHVVRERLTKWVTPSYQDFVDVTGTVTMARVTRPRMAIEIEPGREVEAAFRPEDEDKITTALKLHATTKLRVIGQAQFTEDGRLQKIVEVENVILLPGGEFPFDASAKPIWEEFAEINSTIPQEEFEKLPKDGAERLDYYLHGSTQGDP
jgi:hypothetical protein